ncbi:MAG: hypothetical protein H0W86_07025 [Armatimonadetes bacterium]|nr:hypothetical protein [Armatimonadota bacterium]
MTTEQKEMLSKVPQVTLIFWIIKILATTLGETGGDALTMSFLGETTSDAHPYGYLIGTGVFGVIFFIAVAVQIKAKKFHPTLYWLTIIATTTVGTTLADYVTRSIGIGYAGGSMLLLALVLGSLLWWYRSLGSVSVDTVREPKAEMFYWLTTMFSQTLGTALGDWVADDVGLNLGYSGAAYLFGGMLVLIAGAYFWTKISRTGLFWAAFIITRPLGAVVGDLLDKPIAKGGLELSRYAASAALVVAIAVLILLFKQKPAERAH